MRIYAPISASAHYNISDRRPPKSRNRPVAWIHPNTHATGRVWPWERAASPTSAPSPSLSPPPCAAHLWDWNAANESISMSVTADWQPRAFVTVRMLTVLYWKWLINGGDWLYCRRREGAGPHCLACSRCRLRVSLTCTSVVVTCCCFGCRDSCCQSWGAQVC